MTHTINWERVASFDSNGIRQFAPLVRLKAYIKEKGSIGKLSGVPGRGTIIVNPTNPIIQHEDRITFPVGFHPRALMLTAVDSVYEDRKLHHQRMSFIDVGALLPVTLRRTTGNVNVITGEPDYEDFTLQVTIGAESGDADKVDIASDKTDSAPRIALAVYDRINISPGDVILFNNREYPVISVKGIVSSPSGERLYTQAVVNAESGVILPTS